MVVALANRSKTNRHVILKTATLLVLMAPAIGLPLAFRFDLLGAQPMERLIEETGSFAIRFLLLSLLISPARGLLGWPALIVIRRRIGLASFFYGVAHLCLFAVDHKLGPVKLLLEILRFPYLLIGFMTLMALLPLAITSTDRMMRRLGVRRWRWLHRMVYAIAPLGLLHFILESPTSSIEPLVLGGCLFWLLTYRLWRQAAPVGVIGVIALGLAATAATALAEALYLALKLGAPIDRILLANFGLATGVRPAQIVFGLGLPLLIGAGARAAATRPRPQSRRPEDAASTA